MRAHLRMFSREGGIHTKPFLETSKMIDLLTADELASRLRMKPSTVRDWARRGLIPAIRLSHKVVRYDLHQVVEAMRNKDKESENASK